MTQNKISKRVFNMDYRNVTLGAILLPFLSLLTLFASVGIVTMQKEVPDELNYDVIWSFMMIVPFLILGICIYIMLFTRFNNPFQKSALPNSGSVKHD